MNEIYDWFAIVGETDNLFVTRKVMSTHDILNYEDKISVFGIYGNVIGTRFYFDNEGIFYKNGNILEISETSKPVKIIWAKRVVQSFPSNNDVPDRYVIGYKDKDGTTFSLIVNGDGSFVEEIIDVNSN